MRLRHTSIVAALTVALLGAACGDDDVATGRDRPTVAVTTTILGDVVSQLLGEQAAVVTIMPTGASPHDFQASAQEAGELAGADAIVINGGGFEEGLLSVVDGAEGDGVPVIAALDQVDGEDPHFFTDPLAMAEAVEGIARDLAAEVPALDPVRLDDSAEALVGDLTALHAELEEVLSVVPAEDRVMVTDHDVFSSFAARYGFDVVGTVIPTGSTSDGVSGGDLAALADVLRAEGVRAVFTEQTASQDLAETLAAEVGDEVAVVPLNAESLGPAGSDASTYADMMRTNATRIAEALGT